MYYSFTKDFLKIKAITAVHIIKKLSYFMSSNLSSHTFVLPIKAIIIHRSHLSTSIDNIKTNQAESGFTIQNVGIYFD